MMISKEHYVLLKEIKNLTKTNNIMDFLISIICFPILFIGLYISYKLDNCEINCNVIENDEGE